MQYKRTLQDLYLNPLNSKVRSNNGYPYKNTSNSLQLLIDIKTEARPTLNRLFEILRQYPDLTGAKNLQFVTSGNRPSPDLYTSIPHIPITFISTEILKLIIRSLPYIKSYYSGMT